MNGEHTKNCCSFESNMKTTHAVNTYLGLLVLHRRSPECQPYSVQCTDTVLRPMAEHRLSTNCHRQRYASATPGYCCCCCVASDCQYCALHRNPMWCHPVIEWKKIPEKNVQMIRFGATKTCTDLFPYQRRFRISFRRSTFKQCRLTSCYTCILRFDTEIFTQHWNAKKKKFVRKMVKNGKCDAMGIVTLSRSDTIDLGRYENQNKPYRAEWVSNVGNLVERVIVCDWRCPRNEKRDTTQTCY